MTKILEKKVEDQTYELYQFLVDIDNFTYVLASGSDAIIIDPSDEHVLEEALNRLNLTPKLILVTHAHEDHIKGLEPLKEKYNCNVMASKKAQLDQVDQDVEDLEEYCVGPFCFKTISTPGHSNDHTCYYFESLDLLFSGDTLFLLGCGKIFNGTALEFLDSFDKLLALNDETVILCGHDYFNKNLKFAEYVDGANQDLKSLENRQVTFLTLKIMKKVNPFLRLDAKPITKKVQKVNKVDVFNALIELRADFSEG